MSEPASNEAGEPSPFAHEVQELLCEAAETGSRVYALVDAAQDPPGPEGEGLAARLAAGEADAECLYQGAQPELAAVGPWLVDLGAGDTEITTELLEEGWGRAWLVPFLSGAELAELRKHFRTFLLVEREGGGELYFRFYDPRVLRVYLPTASVDELAAVFGPVEAYLCEGRDPGRARRFGRDEFGALTQEAIDLREEVTQ